MNTAAYRARESQQARYLLRISLAMFMAYLTIGLPLTVLSLYVRQSLGMSDSQGH